MNGSQSPRTPGERGRLLQAPSLPGDCGRAIYGRRLLAAGVDLLLCLLLVALPSMGAYLLLLWWLPSSPLVIWLVLLVGGALGLGGALAYFHLRDASPRWGLGKRLTGLRVLCRHSLQPIGLRQALVRTLILGAIGPVELLFLFRDPEEGQRLGDRVAQTVVLRPR